MPGPAAAAAPPPLRGMQSIAGSVARIAAAALRSRREPGAVLQVRRRHHGRGVPTATDGFSRLLEGIARWNGRSRRSKPGCCPTCEPGLHGIALDRGGVASGIGAMPGCADRRWRAGGDSRFRSWSRQSAQRVPPGIGQGPAGRRTPHRRGRAATRPGPPGVGRFPDVGRVRLASGPHQVVARIVTRLLLGAGP